MCRTIINNTLNEQLPIDPEIVEPDDRKVLQEVKERLEREHEEQEKKARWEVEKDLWTRILLQEITFFVNNTC